MIPFPGESVRLDLAMVVQGVGSYDETLYNDVLLRARSRTLAGEWRAWVYPGSQSYLEDPGTDVVVSWVVEVASGSGTITAAAGLDPSWGDPELTPSQALGTHAISGPMTLVLPTTFTAADVMGDDAVMLVLDGTGSVVVQQIKLRVWPRAGVAGGWSEPLPGFTAAPALPALSGAFVVRGENVVGTQGDYETAWTTAADLIVSSAPGGGEGPHPLTDEGFTTRTAGGVSWRAANPPVSPSFALQSSIDGTNALASGQPTGLLVLLAGPDPADVYPIPDGFVDGVDFIRPPDEVAGDDAYLIQMVGAAAYEWQNTVATLTLPGNPDPVDAGPSVTSDSTDVNPVVAGAIDRDLIDGPAVVVQSEADTVTAVPLVATGRWVIVHASHSMVTTPIPYPGLEPFAGGRVWDWRYVLNFGAGTPGAAFAPMKVAVLMPPYRVWNPTVVPTDTAQPLRLMQRGDGLGMGSGRVFSTGTRQGSSRVFGAL